MNEGFKGVFKWAPMIPREASPSDSCAPDRYFFAVRGRKDTPVVLRPVACRHKFYVMFFMGRGTFFFCNRILQFFCPRGWRNPWGPSQAAKTLENLNILLRGLRGASPQSVHNIKHNFMLCFLWAQIFFCCNTILQFFCPRGWRNPRCPSPAAKIPSK